MKSCLMHFFVHQGFAFELFIYSIYNCGEKTLGETRLNREGQFSSGILM